MKLLKILFILLLIISLFTSLYITNLTYLDIKLKEQSIIELYAERIQSALQSQIQVSKILGEILVIQNGQISDEDFNRISESLYNTGIEPSIAYLANGIFTQVYPYELNSFLLGNSVFEDENARADAIMARDSGEIIVSGPYRLAGGQVGIVIRTPVYVDNAFSGFSSVVVHTNKLLSSIAATNLPHLGYELKISSIYQDEEIDLFISEDFNYRYASNYYFKLGNANLQMDLYTKDKITVVITSFIASFFVLLAINMLIYRYIKKAHLIKENLTKKLETDALTGANNRVKLEKYVKEAKGTEFAIFYLDLNKFKPVNDNYGHEMGDKVLIAFVQRLKAVLKNDSIVARIGGDEFVVIAPNVTNETEALAISRRIKDRSEAIFTFEDIKISISSSIGYVFSKEAKELSDLLAIADKRMYAEKQKNSIRK